MLLPLAIQQVLEATHGVFGDQNVVLTCPELYVLSRIPFARTCLTVTVAL